MNDRIMIFFNKIKDTGVLEQEKAQLWNDYQTYLKVEKSDDIKTYLALKEKVESIPFQEKKKEIEALRFKGSPEEKMVKNYIKHQNNKKLISFFELKSSSDLKRFIEIEKSGQIERLKDLETYVRKGKYKADLAGFKRLKKADKENKDLWEESEAFANKKEYDDLKTAPEIIFYNSFLKSKAYKNYLNIDGSTLLNQYEDLKAEVESENFKVRKAYLEDVKRFEKTSDFIKLKEFNSLDANPNIQLYLKYNDTDAFKFFREWTPTFQDEFKTIDKEVWSFVTPLAEKGPGKNFSVKSQLHYANNSDNFDVDNGILTLETKQEKVQGLYWNEQFGFIPREFNYASGIIHSLNGFTQEYGHFEIKLKASKVKGVYSSVSLFDAEEEICIRLFNSNGAKANGGLITTDHQQKNFYPVDLAFPTKGYAIVALDWTPEKLEWSVNDKLVGSVTQNVPHVPLGLRIETEVLKETGNLPHRLDIDWIKCYKAN